jgi:uncharacterized membrane protein
LPSPRLQLVSLVIVAAVLLAGCAGANTSVRNFKGTEREVADAIGSFESAGQRKHQKKICQDLLTAQYAKSLAAGRSTCEDEVDDAIADADDFKLTVKSVTVSGPAATAQVENADRTFTMRLQRVGGDWRIASLG